MSILTQAIDESRKRTQQDGGQSVLRLAIDRARRGETVEPAQGQAAGPLPTAGARPNTFLGGSRSLPAPSLTPIPTLPKARGTQAVKDEMGRVDGMIRTLQERRSSLNSQSLDLTRGALGMGPNRQELTNRAQALQGQVRDLDAEITRLERDRAGLTQEWDRADAREFDGLRQTADFRTAVDKAMGSPYGFVTANSRKPSHRDVGSAMTYFQAKAKGDGALAEAAKRSADMALDLMSEGQRDRLAYYVGMGDYDGAADYLNRIAPALNRAQMEQTSQGLAEWGKEHPVLGAAVNMVSWPMNIPAYFANAKQAAKNLVTGKDELDPHLAAYGAAAIGSSAGQGVQEAARDAAKDTFGSEFAGDAAAFLVGTGLSVGQNATQIAALGPLSLAGMAMSAAGGSTAEALDRGATPGQAFALGTASGLTEAATEKLPLDNLFRLAKEGGGKGLKAAAADMLKQMGTEATEEAISEVAGNLADAIVMGDNSELNAYIRELQEAGMSKEDAERAAVWRFYVVNTGLAALGGGISGGVMGGGALAAYQMGPGRENAQVNAAIDRTYAAMREKGLFSPEAQEAAKAAADRLDRTGKGPWDGVYLPRASEGAVTLPKLAQSAQETAAAPQEAAEGRQGKELSQQLDDVERHLRDAYENGSLDEAGYQGGLKQVQEARMAVESSTAAFETARRTGQDPALEANKVHEIGPRILKSDSAVGFGGNESPYEAGQSSALAAEDAQKSGRQEIAEIAQRLRLDYSQGKIGDAAFDRAMDGLQAEAELMGMEASQAQELLESGLSYMTEGSMNNGTGAAAGEQLFDRDGGRLSGAGAGGENGGMAEGGPQGPADAGGTAVQRTALGQSLQLEAVSSRELGLVGGTDAKTVRVLPEDAWDGALRIIARQVRRETGLPVRFTLGPMEAAGSGGRTCQVRGAFNENGIFVQADNRSATAEQIADHEIFHSYAQSDPGLVQAVEEAVVDRFSREELDQITDQYIMALRGIVDAAQLNEMDGAAYAQALEEAKNELLADAFAGINAFGAQAADYQETVYETLEDRGTVRPRGRENAQAMDQRTGPPAEQFSFEGRTEDGIEVYETSEEVRRLPYKQRVAAFLDIMRGKYQGRTAKFTAGDGQVYYARFNRNDLNKNIYGDKRSSSQGLTAKVNVGADGGIFELVENAQYAGSKSESGKSGRAHSGISSWDYFIKTVQIDGQVFDLLANVRKKPGGEYVYSIQLNESTKKTSAPPRQYRDGTAQSGGSRPGGAPTDVFGEAPAPSLASSHSMNGDAQNRMLTGAFSETDAGYITKPRRGTGNRGSASVSSKSDTEFTAQPHEAGRAVDSSTPTQSEAPASDESNIARDNSPVKPWDGTLPRGTDRELTLPGGQERYSAQEEAPDRFQGPPQSRPSGFVGRGGQREQAQFSPKAETETSGLLADETLPTLAQVQERKEGDGGGRAPSLQGGPHPSLEGTAPAASLTGPASADTPSAAAAVDALPAKARDYLQRAERRLTSRTGKLLGVPWSAQRQFLQDIVRDMSAEYLETGRISQETSDRLFEQAYELGVQAGQNYGPDAAEFKRLARRDFDEAASGLAGELRQVRRYADERTLVKEAPQIPATPQEAAELYRRKKGAFQVYQRAAARNLLTGHDQIQVGRLLRGELELEHLDPAKDNVHGITAVYEAKREYEELAKTIRAWNSQRKAQLMEQADGFLESANQWKDKAAGILYSRETMERNIRDIVPDQDLAERINKHYFQPVHQAAAEANKTKNQYRDRVRALKLSRKKAAGNAVSESYAVQLLGEAEDNIRRLEESQGRKKELDGKTLQEWQAAVAELWEKSPSLDQDKIRGAVKEFRAIYDELFQRMNETRVRNGYEPVSYRQGYFPHFQADSEGLMAQFGRALGIDTAVTNLPTTINGLTHTFKPGIQYFANALERKGFDTAYDAVQGFDRYIEGAADVIHQTDNIQALRALAAQARYRTGDEGLRQQVDQVKARSDISEEEKQVLINKINEEGKFALSNFVVELDEYTNLLANKKSRADRNMEQALGRRMYNIVKGLESRVAANMVAVNPASWLTNFVPLTQGWGTVKTRFMLEGMWDSLKAVKADDGMVGMSSFLTNRRGSDPIVKTWAQGASAWLSRPMDFIDCLTADSLVRARFKQNQAEGLSEAASIEEADAWAAGVMADRSKGATPTLFNRSNPLTKVFTQFQLEVNNQLSYLFKDLPSDLKKKGLAALAAGLLKFLVGAYLYNEAYEHFIGRRCALDPIGILNDSVGDFTGYQVPNLVGMAVDAAQGKEISFETEKKKPFDAVTGLGTNVAEELPFIGGVLGGGRVPISSALPDWENLAKAAVNNEWDGRKRAATALKALSGPATYWALPFGGGQVKKIYQGLKAVHEGGSWTVDNKGNDILQYPVFNETAQDTLLTLPTALTFGKSSLPTAREWAERGFKSMSAKQTACYQGMTELGVPQRDAYQLLLELGDVEAPAGEDTPATEKKAYQQRKLLQETDISDQGKGAAYYTLMASDKERELMDSLREGGADMGEAAKVLMELKDAEAELKGGERSAAKKKAIAGSSLSEEEKDAVFGYMLGKDSTGAAWSKNLAEAGLDERSAAIVANALNALTPEEGQKTVSEVQKWRAAIDAAGGMKNQKTALLTVMSESARMRYEIADQYGIKAEAWVQVKEALPQFDANKNGSYSSGEIEKAIDALAGDGRLLAPWDKDPIRLSREEKAVLWQLFAGSASGSGNPYSTRVGRQVAKDLERAREEAKK